MPNRLIRFLSRRKTGRGINRGTQQQVDPKQKKHVIVCTVVLLDGTNIDIELPVCKIKVFSTQGLYVKTSPYRRNVQWTGVVDFTSLDPIWIQNRNHFKFHVGLVTLCSTDGHILFEHRLLHVFGLMFYFSDQIEINQFGLFEFRGIG